MTTGGTPILGNHYMCTMGFNIYLIPTTQCCYIFRARFFLEKFEMSWAQYWSSLFIRSYDLSLHITQIGFLWISEFPRPPSCHQFQNIQGISSQLTSPIYIYIYPYTIRMSGIFKNLNPQLWRNIMGLSWCSSPTLGIFGASKSPKMPQMPSLVSAPLLCWAIPVLGIARGESFTTGWWFSHPCEKYESQLGWWNSQLNGKIKLMFQTTNQTTNDQMQDVPAMSDCWRLTSTSLWDFPWDSRVHIGPPLSSISKVDEITIDFSPKNGPRKQQVTLPGKVWSLSTRKILQAKSCWKVEHLVKLVNIIYNILKKTLRITSVSFWL